MGQRAMGIATANCKSPTLSCDSWLMVARPHLHPALIAPPAFARARTVARLMPADCTAILEARLAADAPRTDFSVRLENLAQAAQLAPQVKPQHLQGLLAKGWSQLGFPDQVPALWLEFDLAAGAPEIPDPIVCARLASNADPDWIARVLLPALHGSTMSAAQDQNVRRALATLPAGYRLLYAFSLHPRSDAVRLEFLGFDLAAAVAYLRRVVSVAAAEQIAGLAHLAAEAERFHLSFDIAAEISPRIGLEYAIPRQPPKEFGWQDLLERLVRTGLCSAEKRDAIFAWPGYDTPWTQPSSWPHAPPALATYCVRCLSHLKLVVTPDAPPESKVYLLLQALRPNPSKRSKE